MNSILFLVFRVLGRLRLSALTAALLLLTSRRLFRSKRGLTNGKKQYRALVMARAGFLEDIEESFRLADEFEVVCWPSYALKALSSGILSPALDHNNYLSDDPDIEASKVAYREFLSRLWRYYTAKLDIDVVLTGNFAYFTEREFATALEEAGTPFIALHKENVRPPRRVKDYWFTLYKERRGKFTGRKILVYNEVERELEILSGIVDPNKVVITGAPRLDKLHRWRLDNAGQSIVKDRPTVLFFAFSRQDKLTAIQRKKAAGVPGNMEPMHGDWGKLTWGKFCEETHQAIVDLARERPDIDVVVKSKGQSRKLTDIVQILESMNTPLPENLRFVPSGNPFDLITAADVVVGFNTTGLLEAIAAAKPVIVPMFGEAKEESMRDLIIDLGAAVEYADSTSDLKSMITSYVDQPKAIARDLSGPAKNTLSRWTGNDDGKAGHRVMGAIRVEMNPSNTVY